MHAIDSTVGGRPGFPATDLSLVERLLEASPATRRMALEAFCATYWRPVYFHVRVAWSRAREDAKDLTQGFFAWLLEDDTLRRYAAPRGSLRTFMKALLRQYILDRDKAAACVRRGGGRRRVALGEETLAADQVRDRLWVESLLGRAIRRVRVLFASSGRALQFRAFEAYELSGEGARTYGEVAARLGVKEGDVRNWLHAVREAVRGKVLSELRRQSADEEEFQLKLDELFEG